MRGANPRHSPTMNFELPKQLNDSGFPQQTNFGWLYDEDEKGKPVPIEIKYLTPEQRKFKGEGNEATRHDLDGMNCWCKMKIIHHFQTESPDIFIHNAEIACPTLSELIEACGKPIWIESMLDGFLTGRGKGKNTPLGTGKTPEEAVARLWLALNTDH